MRNRASQAAGGGSTAEGGNRWRSATWARITHQTQATAKASASRARAIRAAAERARRWAGMGEGSRGRAAPANDKSALGL